jgi:hypothetical protein
MKAICADSNLRLAGYAKKPSLLDKGIFYSTDYFRALKSIGKLGAKRFEFLFEQGAFIHGLAPKDFFSIKKSFPDHPHHSFHITGKIIRGYEMKEGVSASNALRAVFNSLIFLDCAQVCFLSYYYAIFDLLGEDRFNLLFTEFNLEINKTNPLAKVIKTSSSASKKLDKAQLVYVTSIESYAIKHPCETAQGYNLLCLESGRSDEISFLGFGLSESGANHEEIKLKLLSDYNAPTTGHDIIPEKYKGEDQRTLDRRARELDSVKASKQEFFDSEAGQFNPGVLELDFERLEALAKALTDEEAFKLFDKMGSRI